MAKKKRNKSGNPAVGSAPTVAGARTAAPVAQSTYSVTGSTKAPASFYTSTWFEFLSVLVVSALSFWLLTARIVGVHVSVLADEYLYVLDAHYKGLDEATYPNYLFQWIYSSTKMCGAEFYSCARGINALFVIFGAVFIYLLAKFVGRSKLLGGLAAVAAILGSYGTFTAYFMPEAIFNGLMMFFFWALIRFGKAENLVVWAAIGTILGIASLAKPHGLFVIPAVVVFVFLWTRATREKWLIAAILRGVVFVSAVVGSKFLFGYLLAGERALSLFGMYGTVESVTQSVTTAIATTSGEGTTVLFTAWGQILMIVMILGLILPVAVHGLILSLKKDPVVIESVKYRALIGLLLASLLPAIALFESWANLGALMHTRYYSYLIPLAIVALIEAAVHHDLKLWPWAKYSVVAVFLVLGGINLATAAMPYSTNWVDAPDFKMHIDNLGLSFVFTAIALVAAVVWLWRSKASMAVGLIIAVAASAFSGVHSTSFLKSAFGYETPYDHVSRVLRSFLPQNELDTVFLIGQYEMLQRTLFSSLTGSGEIKSATDSLDISEIEPTRSWLVAFGDQVLTGFDEPAIVGDGFKLYSLSPTNSLKPREESIKELTGACLEASQQAWSCGGEVSFALTQPFSAKATVDLIFEVSDWAAGKELEFVLGDSSFVGQFGKGLSSVYLRFANSYPGDTMTIRIKQEGAEELTESQKFVRPVWGFSKPAS